MTAQVISGRDIAQQIITQDLIPHVKALRKKGIKPKLVVILVGDNPASVSYITQKEKLSAQAGVLSEVRRFPKTVTQAELLKEIEKINHDNAIHGVIVQLPLPDHIDVDKVIQSIDPSKDVDGFTPTNNRNLETHQSPLPPCTPKGIMTLLKKSDVSVSGKRTVVMGRSRVVGKPVAQMLRFAGADVIVLHSQTPPDRAAQSLKNAEILIVAVGKPQFVHGNQLSPGCIVIDVGIHRQKDGSFCGDVHFESVSKIASKISPVPGGVGPMTVVSLIENTVKAAENNNF